MYLQSGSLDAMKQLVALIEPSWDVLSALFRVELEKEQFQELTFSEKPMVVDSAGPLWPCRQSAPGSILCGLRVWFHWNFRRWRPAKGVW